ncbi:MAG: SusD/RagB family nutrient-binding outer membrane lipoprotein, partial [Bacteroidales bacterium]|nr:SusD/RagB family nutrient-binding outer membrane lipoprotein [Bacteroidales bacterium]
MDEVNKDLNNTTQMDAKNLLPDIILKTAHETTGPDLAWYATVFIEHSAGTWAQSSDADRREGQSASTYNNSWNNLYNVLTICKSVLSKTDPVTGIEPDNYWVRGVTQILTAYNLAVATDFWGEIPWTEACLDIENLKPKYEKQSVIYGYIFDLLDDAVINLD